MVPAGKAKRCADCGEVWVPLIVEGECNCGSADGEIVDWPILEIAEP